MTQPHLPGSTVTSVGHAVRPAPRPPAVPHSPSTMEGAVATTAAAPRATAEQPAPSRHPSGTLIAAVVLQSCQALVWLLVGLLMTIGYNGAHISGPSRVNEPVAVVLVIAAILAFAIGAFVLALTAGVLGRSDVCRVASVIFQTVFGALVLAGSIEIIHNGTAAGLTIALAPDTGPAFLITPTVIAALLTSCIATAALLLHRQSTWATKAHYGRHYR